MACLQGSIIGRLYLFSTFGWLTPKGPPHFSFIHFQHLDGSPARVHHRSHLLIFDL